MSQCTCAFPCGGTECGYPKKPLLRARNAHLNDVAFCMDYWESNGHIKGRGPDLSRLNLDITVEEYLHQKSTYLPENLLKIKAYERDFNLIQQLLEMTIKSLFPNGEILYNREMDSFICYDETWADTITDRPIQSIREAIKLHNGYCETYLK